MRGRTVPALIFETIRSLIGRRSRQKNGGRARFAASTVVSVYPKLSLVGTDGNSLQIDGLTRASGKITFKGSGNSVAFGADSLLDGSIQIQGRNNRILIGPHCAIRGRILVKGDDQTVSIGEHTTFQSVYLLCQEGCDIAIGRWCMFSRDIEIRTTDAHSVIERSSGQRLNAPASVTIGDHVWISVGALISKGVSLPDDSVVGAKAFVNSGFSESGTMIAGAPAKIVKRGVTWHRNRKSRFSEDEMAVWHARSDGLDDANSRED